MKTTTCHDRTLNTHVTAERPTRRIDTYLKIGYVSHYAPTQLGHVRLDEDHLRLADEEESLERPATQPITQPQVDNEKKKKRHSTGECQWSRKSAIWNF